MWFAILAALLLALYLGIVGLATVLQDALIFPVGHVAASPERLPDYAERIEIVSGGETLAGVRLRPRPDAAGPIVVGFGGNAWNADHLALYLGDLFETAEIVAFHYRGYPPSTGRPGAEAMRIDALRIFDEVAGAAPGRPVIVVGFSIGAGIAAWLASQRPVAGVLLVTPFDSLHALARDHYRFLPVELILRHRIDTLAYLKETRVPIAVVAAGVDTIVPLRRSEALVSGLPSVAFHSVIPGADHNDLYGRADFAEAMAAAMDRLLALSGKTNQ